MDVGVLVSPDGSGELVGSLRAEGLRPRSTTAELAGECDVVVCAADGGLQQTLAAVSALRKAGCERIVVAGDSDADTTRQLLNAGASGIVVPGLAGNLAATVRAVGVGQVVVPANLRAAIDRPLLTGREKQILAMVVMGFANLEIASQLYVAESTVKSHLGSAFKKLGVRSRKQATALILDEGAGLGAGILGMSRQ